MAPNPSPTPEPVLLRPLPAPEPIRRGYFWAAVLVGAVLLVVMAVVAWAFFGVPGVDPVRAAGWYFAISLMIIIPAALVVLVLSWGVIAAERALGARNLPALLQAAPAVALIIGLVYLLLRFLLSVPDL